MKKNKVDKILVEQTKKRKTILSYACIILSFSILSCLFLYLYLHTTGDSSIRYNENSNIDYKVYLVENNFFEEKYLGKNRSYIASLIDYIDATFNYNIDLQNPNGEFRYAYRIEAEVDVHEKNSTTSLFNFKEEVKKRVELDSNGKTRVNVTENVIIDYNRYNNLINSFLKTYNLDDTISTITLKMYVDVLGKCEQFNDNRKNESVMAIQIPLTTKTMNIEISNDLIETENNIMACNRISHGNILLLLFFIFMLLVDIFYIVLLFIYIIKTRTAEDVYHKELKKILNNYHSYIQKINSELDVSKYQLLKVDTFTDMLEIRDTLQQPILMVQNKKEDGVYFIIPSNTKILYTYGLKLSDIKKQMNKYNT